MPAIRYPVQAGRHSGPGIRLIVTITVNGKAVDVEVAEDTPLLWVLRDTLGLAATKFGCGAGLCGACTVHVDGQPVRSCLTTLSEVADAEVVTVEGLSGSVAEAVQNAWERLDVVQCGYCQSGQIMSAIALLSENANPSDADIDAAMQGNVCRCATYVRIRAAIYTAAKSLSG